jgi:hypothetical protein
MEVEMASFLSGRHAYGSDLVPFVLALVAVGLALVTAWLGGELVYRLRVGVDDDAGLNARTRLTRDGVASARPPEGTADAGG